MKKIFFACFFSIIMSLTVFSQADTNTDHTPVTATMKSAGRLFSIKDDLTSVLMIIPSDSTVTILDADSTYYHVVFQDAEGYIFKKQAVIDKVPVEKSKPSETQVSQQQHQSRFSYLENKYGTSMASRIYTGKIWKGMNAQMVNDSWGSAIKINRVIEGNTIREEWIYNNTWLYFENNTLLDWGPVKK